MKYLAILKDSLREALDSKVLYVLFGLSLLMILFVATLSFRPLAAEKTLTQVVNGSMIAILDALKPETHERKQGDEQKGFPFQFQGSPYQFESAAVIRGNPDAPDSDYLVTLSKSFGSKEGAATARAEPAEELEAVRKQFARLEEYGYLRIGAVRLSNREPGDDPRVAFEMELFPTRSLRRLWLHEPSLFFGLVPLSRVEQPLGFQIFFIAQLTMSMGSWLAVLLGVIITSFFIPNMLQKGSIDLLLVKPIRRSLLLAFKFVGGLTFILLVNAFAVTGIWLVLGFRSGIWGQWTLLLIPILTFFFAILYSVSTLMAVLTRSTVAAILVTIGVWLIFFGVGLAHELIENEARKEERAKLPPEERVISDHAARSIVGGVHRVLPRTSDLNQLADLLVFSDFVAGGYLTPRRALSVDRNWWESFGVSSAFIGLMMGLACWRFSRKDY